ncbi:phage portal protein, partial [Acinetobacter baumannii]|nr:phage portal protein [Acinetobacter baumannii]
RPNPRESGTRLLETVYADLLLGGTGYLEAVSLDGRIAALQALRPGRMRMLPGADGWPAAYVYTVGGTSRRFDLPAPGAPEVAPILALS